MSGQCQRSVMDPSGIEQGIGKSLGTTEDDVHLLELSQDVR
jgi:hypothetical protein